MAEDGQNGDRKDQQQPPKSPDQTADDPNLWVERNPRNPEDKVELTEAINAEANDDASLSNLHYGSGPADRDPIGAGGAAGAAPGDVDPVPERDGEAPARPAGPGLETNPVELSDPIAGTPAPPLADTDPPGALARGGGRSITGRVGADFVPGAAAAPEPADGFVGATAGLTEPPAGTELDATRFAGADEPEVTLAALPVSVAEDETVPLLILVDMPGDASELVVRIGGLPEGAALSAGAPLGDGVWQLSPDQLPGLEMTPPAHFSGEILLSVDVLGPEADDGRETLAGTGLEVDVAAIADKPLLDYHAEETSEGALALKIDSALVDTDGSESLALFLDRLPEGAVVSDGDREAVVGADGTLPLEGWDLDALTIEPPAGVAALEFEIRAEATEEAGGPAAVTVATVEAAVPPRQPVISITAADQSAANEVVEGDSGLTAVDYVISLDQPASQDIYVQYRTVDDSAKGVWSEELGTDLPVARAGGLGDFYAVTGWVMIPAGETEAVITAYVAGDNRTEEHEEFRAELLDARDAPDEDGEAFGVIDVDRAMVATTILDDDRAAPPDLSAADATGEEDTAIPLDISASVTDAGDTLSLISVGGLPEGAVLSDGGNSVTVPQDTTAVDITDWDLDALAITPPPDANGVLELTITAQAQDGSDVATSEKTVTVTVTGTNDGPVADAGTDTATEDGGAVAGTLSSSDVDGDDLAFSLVTPPAEGSVTVNADGSYSFDPGSDFQDLGVGETRDVSFTYEVDDGEGGAAQASVTVTVTGTNDGPVADAGTDTATEDGGAVNGTLSSSDVDGDDLTFSLVTPPAEGSVTVNADGTYTFDPGSDFQDLGVGETRDVAFTYEVDDGEGGTAQASVTVTVTGTNDGPVANPGTDTATEDGGAVNGTLSSSDVDGDSLTFSLVTPPAEGSVTVNADGTYTFDPGSDFQDLGVGETRDVSFTYEVDDGEGGTAQASITVTVTGTNDGPVADAGTDTATEDGGAVNGTLSSSDVDGDDLTFSLVTPPAEGSVTVNADGSYTFDPGSDFQDLGVGETRDVSFTYEVDDGEGGTAQASITVTVTGTNDGPVADAGTDTATEDGGAVNGTLSSSDVDGDDLTFSLVTPPAEGSVTVNADGSYTFDPGSDFQDLGVGETRDVSFTYEVDDGEGGTAQASVTVTVTGTNDGPVADAGTASATEDGGAVNGTLSSSDVDGDDLTFSLVTPPAEGSVTVNADGSYTFDPGSDFQDLGVGETRDVAFTYEVDDGEGGTAQASVTVTVTGTNDGPVADAGTASATEDGGAVNGTLSSSDVDGDDLTFSLVTPPAEGSVTVNADGSYSFDPGSDFQDLGVGETRDVAFTYEVDDGEGGTAQASVTVTVTGTNDGPVADAGTASATEDGGAVNGTLSSSDVDGDDLTFSLVTPPAEGSVTVNADGSYSFDPGSDFQDLGVGETRDVAFTYEVDDGEGGTAQASVTVTVTGTNDGPVADAGTASATEDGGAVNGTLSSSDVDGDDLTFSLVTPPAEGSVTVNADGSYSFDPGSDFQDLGVGETRDVAFTYEVDDGEGGTAQASVTVTVTGTNDGPVASPGTDTATEDGGAVNGTLSSSDVDGDSLTFSLVTPPAEGSVTVNADGSYAFDPGSDFQDLGVGETRDVSFTYEVDDGEGGTAQASVTVTVTGTNDGPVADAGTDTATEDGGAVNGTLSSSDVDGDTLTFSLVTPPAEGSVTVNADGTYSFDPGSDFQDLGVGETRDVSFTYEVDDGEGGTAQASVTVTVTGTNDGPVASPGTDTATEDGGAVNGTLSSSDVDGDSLTFSLVTPPAEGSVTVNADGSYTFDPGSDFQDLGVGETRDVSFTYEVDDGEGGTAQASVTVTVTGTNDGPVADAGTQSATEDGGAVAGTLSSSDVDGDDLTFSLVTPPAEGSVTVNADGTYTFDPGSDFQDLGVGETRDVSFTYEVDDGEGGTAQASVTVTVTGTNDGPVADAGTDTATEDGGAVNGTLSSSDVDGDSLTFSLVTPPAEGSVTVNADGSYSFDPGSDFQDLGVGETRDVSFTYEVDDGEGGTAQASVTVTVTGTNDGPVASPGTDTATEDGGAVNGTLSSSDVDGDDLTFSLVTPPAEGSVTVNADGSYTFDPGSDFQDLGVGETRDVAFTYEVDDGEGGTAQASITVTVTGTNDGPVANPGTDTAIEDGGAVNGTLSSSDVDGDDLTFSLVTPPAEGSVTVNADGSYTFDPGSDFQDLGVGETRDVAFTYEVDDGEGGTAQASITVTVTGTNDGPVADAGTASATEDGGAVNGTLSSSDVDGDDLTFSLVTPPAEGSVTVNADGSYTFDPGSDFQDLGVGETRDVAFTYEVDDGEGGTAQASVTVTVTGTNDGPVADAGTQSATEDGGAVNGTLSSSDVDGDDLTFSLVTPPAEGSVTVNADGTYSFDPGSDFQDLGVGETRDVSFTYEVDDGEGGTAQASITVTVTGTNDGPVADAGTAAATEDGGAVNGTLSSSDVDGDDLTYSLATPPAEGSVTVNADGTYSFDPGSDFQDLGVGETRDVTFTYEVDDGEGGTAQASVTVTVTGTNDGPVADAGTASATEDGGAVNGTLSSSDVDGDDLTFSLVTPPAEGSVTVNADGSYTFDPGSDFQDLGVGETRDVAFTYEVDDGEGGTAQASVTVTVTGTNDGPVADAGTQSATEDGGAVNGTLSSSDVDGDDLTFSLVTPPAEGSVTVNADGTYSFDPGSDFQDLGVGETRDVSFTYEVDDGEGGTAQASITVTVTGTNDGPVANPGTDTAIEDGGAVNGTLSSSDVDGDDLTFSLVTPPAEGSVTVNADGSYTFDPGSDFQDLGVGETRDVAFTYEVDDGEGGTAQASITVTVTGTNDGPVADAGTASATEDGGAVNGTLSSSDVDGDDLTFSLVTPPAEGSVTVNADGSYTFDPGSDFQDLGVGETRDVAFTYEVDDGEGGTAQASVTVTVTGTNDGPVADAGTDTATEDGGAVNGTLSSSDVDGDSLTFSLVTPPAEGSVTVNADGSYSFDPGSDFQDLGVGETRDVSFTYEVDDGEGGTAQASVTVTVTGTNDGPVASPGTDTATEDGGAVNGTLSSSDVDGDDLTFSLVTPPAEGSVTVNADGSYTFDPGSDFQDLGVGETRDVAFTYEVDDGEGGTAQASITVTVTGTNDGPVANPGTDTAIEDGGAVNGTLSSSDVDGDDLTFSLVTPPAEGSVTVNADGSYTFDPGSDFQDLGVGETRDVAFTYEVDDGEGGTAQASITVTVTGTNDGPVADAGTASATEDGGAVNGTLSSSDVDGDDLTFSLVTPPAEGSVTVNADGSYTFDPGSDFQDLGVGETRDVAFTYEVDDGEGGTAQASVTVTVTGTNDGPVADAGTQSATEDGGAVNGTLSSSDVDGDDLTFSLVTPPAEGSVTVNADGTYSFDPGSDFQDLGVGETRDVSFTYEVDDGEGGTAQASITVTVTGTNDGPVADAGTAAATEDGGAVNGTLSSSDVDGDDLTYSLATPPAEGSVTVNADGTYSFDPGSDFQDLGVGETRDVTFTYEVDDGEGGTAQASVTVTVTGTNDGPVADAGTASATEDGGAVNGTLSSSDVDGDDLTFSLVTPPAEGSVTVNADGSYTFDPGSDFQDLGVGETRDVAFTYEVDDGEGGTAQASVTVTVTGTNDGPVADAGTQSATEDGGAVNGTLSSSDVDGDDLTFSLVTPPAEGSVTVNADGTYSFDPGSDFQDLGVGETRDVSFTYEVDDGEGGTAQASITVTVTGTNDGPVANPGTDTAIEDGGAVNGTLSSSDVDGDDLTFSLVTPPAEGSVTVNADGSYTFDPGSDFQDLGVGETRDVAFTYEVDDGEGGTAQASITVTVTGTNDGPVADAGTASATEDGGAVNGTLSSSDVDGDDLTFSLVTPPAEGSVTVNADGSYTFDPGSDFQDLGVGETRDVAFTYEVDDGEGGTAQASVTVTVTGTNDGPVADAGTQSATEDGGAVNGTLSSSDVDGDDLTFSLVTPPAEGSVTVNADGTYSFDPGSDFQDLGVGETRDVSFTYEVDDGEGGTAQASVTVTVTGTNDGPVANPGTDTATEDGGAVNGTLSSSDVDGDTLTFSLVTPPAEGSVTVNADGTYTFDPGSDFQDLGVGETRDVAFTYEVDDGEGGTAQASVTVTVTGTNDGPVASPGTDTATEDGGAVNGTLSSSDVDGDDLTYSLVTPPAEGSVTVNADGSYAFDPGSDFQDLGVGETRDVSFTYEVDDGEGGTAQATVTVTVTGTNDGPVASPGTDTATEDGGAVNGTLSSSDVDGDDLTFSLVTPPAEGSVTVNADGSYTFDPGSDFQDLGVGETRDVAFTYEVDDGEGGTAQASVTVTVTGTNDGPAANPGTDTATEDGGAVNGTLSSSDVDGDDLTYSLVTPPAEGSVTVNADGTYSFDPGSDFQDLGVGETRDVSFTYEVDDGEGGTAQASVTVTVTGTNDGPVADAGTASATEDGGAVNGTLSSSDVDGDDLTFSLVTPPAEGSVTVNADGTYSFDPGSDFQDLGVGETRDVSFTYEVDDGEGGTAQATVTVTVTGTNDGPVADAGTQSATEDGGAVNGTLSSSDVDGDSLTFSLVTPPAEGSVTVNADGSYTFDPGSDFQDLGVGETRDVAFTYEVDDGEGGTAQASITVTVTGTNDGPVADAGTASATEDGGAVAGTLSSSDVDGDSLTFSLATPPAEGSVTVNADGTYSFDPGSDFQDLGVGETRDVSFTYEVDDGEGGTAQASITVTVTGTNDGPVANPGTDTAIEDGGAVNGTLSSSDVDGDDLTFSLVTPPAEGSVTVNADGSYTFDPGSDFQDLGVGETRDVAFTYEVDDGEGGTAQASITVTVTGTNDGPVADAGTASATEDGGAVNGTLSSSDVDGDDLTFSLVTPPAEGSVTVNADGTYSFDPGSDFQDLGVGETRDVAFTYEVDDGEGGTAQASVTVTVTGTNDGPVADAGTAAATEDGGAVNGTLSSSDVDGDDLTYSLVTPPAEGSVTVNADGTYSFDPGSDFQDLGVGETRDVSFTYEVDDGEGGTAQASVTVTVTGTNDGPVADAGTASATEDGGAVAGTLSSSDVDGDSLTFSLATPPAEGSVTVNADGTYSFDPGSDFQDLGVGETRDVAFTYEVDDGEGGTAQASVTVTVTGTNDGPVASPGTDTATEDGGAVAGILSSSDVDGDSLTFSLATPPAEGSVTVNADGTYSFDPGSDFQDLGVGETRDVAFTYEVDDGEGGTAQASVTVTVTGTNDGPVASPGTDTATEDGGAVAGILSSSDVDGDSLTFSLATPPAEGSVTVNADGTYSFDPGSDFQDLGVGETRDVSFTYEVDDGEGGTAQASVTVTVTGTNDGPVVSGPVDLGATNEDTGIVITEAQLLANASDIEGETLSVSNLSLDSSANGSLTDHGDGTWTFTPAANIDGSDIGFGFDVSDGTDTTAASAVIDITAVADAPGLTVTGSASGTKDNGSLINVPQSIIDTGTDVTIAGVPTGATLSAGTDNGGGSWTVANSDLDDLWLMPNGATGTANLTFTVTGGTSTVLSADFDSGLDGFTYQDDTFRGTSEASYASGGTDSDDGVGGSGALDMDLGGIDGADITDMSGGFSHTFTVPEGATGTLTFSYKIEMGSSYESDEYVEVLASIDGTLYGTGGNDYVDRMYGGGDSGWQTVTIDLGSLTPGTHTLTLGGYNNKKTQSSESTEINFDNVSVTVDTPNVNEAADVSLSEGIVLDIDASLADTDGSETLMVEVSGVPTGATLSAGTDLGGGVWSLTAAELPGLTMTPPPGFTGDYDLTVTATSTESSNSDTATTSASTISVSVTGPQVAPEVSGAVDLGATNEDTAIVITEAELLANATDGNNDTLSVTGLSLQNGAHGTLTDHGDGTWTFTPAADFSGDDIALDYNVTDGTDSTAASAVIDVTAVADAPALSGSASTEGYQDNAEPVAVPQEIIDTGNAVTVTGVPTGATLSAGTDNGGGNWTVANADLDGLMLIPNGNTGAVTLNFDAGTSATEIFSADFDSGWDGFSYSDDAFHDGEGGSYDTESGSRASGSADGSGGVGGSGGLELNLGGTGDDGTTDMAGGFSTTFTVPEGATGTLTFSYRIEMDASYESDEYVEVLASIDGTLHGTGGNDYVTRMYDGGDSGWQTVSIDLGTLTPGTHTLTIGGYNNKATQSSETAEISFDNVAISTGTNVTGSVGLTLEDGIALDISAALSDTDGSESLAVEISGVPTGATLSAGTDLGGGVWSVDSGDLSGLTIDPPDGYNGSFDLTVKATATESANSDTEVSTATITVDVKALTDTSSTGTPGQITSGTSGDDSLTGTAEDDQLLGLSGDDTLSGGAGDDTITGGEGDDLLYGGDGSDLFIFAEGDGQNTVDGGGGSWTDTIELEGFEGQSAEQGWTLTLDSGDTITGTGADYLDLSADSSGTITFDDGTEIVFEGIDKIVW